MIIIHYAKTAGRAETPPSASQIARKVLEPAEPLPPGAVWIDMIEPTIAEDKQVQEYLGCRIPTRADPDYAEPPEAHYAEEGVRYLRASVISEAEDTPDVTGVTFVICDSTLVTVRYDASESFEVYGQKICRAQTPALQPDAVAIGLVDTIVNLSARALGKVGVNLDDIGNAVFAAQGDNSKRSRIYSSTLAALGREDERISNLRESLLSIERLLLFLSAEGRAADVPKPVREATKSALRDLQSLEEDASFKAQKVQFLLDATLGFINLAQNDIIKLFSVLAVIFMPPTVIASIYGMNFKEMPELEWRWGYPFAILLMICAAIGPYLIFPVEEVAVRRVAAAPVWAGQRARCLGGDQDPVVIVDLFGSSARWRADAHGFRRGSSPAFLIGGQGRAIRTAAGESNDGATPRRAAM